MASTDQTLRNQTRRDQALRGPERARFVFHAGGLGNTVDDFPHAVVWLCQKNKNGLMSARYASCRLGPCMGAHSAVRTPYR